VLAVLLLLLCDGWSLQAADHYAGQVDYMAHSPPVVQPPSESNNNGILEGLLFLAVVVLAFRVAAPRLGRRLDTSIQGIAEKREPLDHLYESEPSLVALFEALRAIDLPHGGVIAASREAAQAGEQNPCDGPESLPEFFKWARKQATTLCRSLTEASRSTDVETRQKLLLELSDLLRLFKERCSMPELRALWQLAYALEVLLKQLARNESLITASALKTAAGALDLIKVLSAEGISPTVAADAPIRLLAVDDDPVSRCALSLALQKVFDPPDTAPDGQGGLALATEQSYDIIFLDVEMPGMDGFELCRKIRQTALNRATPVVFVTRHSDFNARARTAVAGGNELIGKPFLALEIALKALTLVLGSRQRSDRMGLESAETLIDPAALAGTDSWYDDFNRTGAPDDNSLIEQLAEEPVPSSDGRFDREQVHFEELRSRVKAAMRAQDAAARQDMLGELYIGVHKLSVQTERDEQNTAHRLSASLEDLLRKLLERPALCTPYVLDAADDALDLLGELRASGEDPDFFEGSFRILVVDDDPIARRAVAGSLQMIFGRPETAGSGEAAFDLAAEAPFDLIFLDVVMPGMDGFETCAKIRQTGPNRQTPILFVTGHDDADSRWQAFSVGGCGFIAKPVLSREILLRTLTLLLRGRCGTTRLLELN
jgi:CheY-like chemotaxis protein